MIAKEVCPEIERHISTQANNTNYGTYHVLVSAGSEPCGIGKRTVAGRDLKEFRANIPADLEIETFIHGAMCISYSGRCLLSNYLYRKRCQPGSMYPSMPLEICGSRGDKTGRIYAGL